MQTKLQDNQNETQITSLLNRNFKVKVINMLMYLQKNIQDFREDLNKKIHLLKSHSEPKNTVTKMKNTMEAFNRLSQVKEVANDLESGEQENNEAKKTEKRISGNERIRAV